VLSNADRVAALARFAAIEIDEGFSPALFGIRCPSPPSVPGGSWSISAGPMVKLAAVLVYLDKSVSMKGSIR